MVGVGTNLRPRETTSHSAVERVCPERLSGGQRTSSGEKGGGVCGCMKTFWC